jgi:peptide deformylase
MIRTILIHPDPRLKKPCDSVGTVTPDIVKLAEDMLETMYDAPGVGLAAPQVGVMKRVLVMDCVKDPALAPRPMVLINPSVTWLSEDLSTYEEGCLSIPDYYETIQRPTRVKVAYQDRVGAPQEIEAEGLMATCLQHEIDHIYGVLFVDHLSRLKRERVMKKFQKAARLRESEQA